MSKLRMNLQMFDEGAAAPAAANGAPASAQAEGTSGEGTTTQQPAAGKEAQKTPEQLKAEFEGLIKGEYKSLYDARVQAAINKRLTHFNGIEAENQKMRDTLALLGQKYGTEDPEELFKKISDDNSFYEKQALEQGVPVEQYKAMQQLQYENQRLRAQQTRQEQEVKNRAFVAELEAKAQEVRNTYPNFDLRTELQNPQFNRLVSNGIDLQTAYQVIHQADLMQTAMEQAAREAAAKQAANVEMRSQRPSENGMSSQSGVVVKTDVSKLTRKDREELAKRARRGEHITLS